MSGINRIPGGYLDLVGSQTGGKNPSDAAESVMPVVSMNELYSAQTLSPINFATNSTVIGSTANTFVPSDESWIMYAASMNTVAPLAGDQDVVGLFVQQLARGGASAGTVLIFQANLLSLGVNFLPSDTVLFPTPFVLPGGTKLIAQVQQRLGGAANRVVNVALLVGKLKG